MMSAKSNHHLALSDSHQKLAQLKGKQLKLVFSQEATTISETVVAVIAFFNVHCPDATTQHSRSSGVALNTETPFGLAHPFWLLCGNSFFPTAIVKCWC
jgi:hypothetical protein